MEKNQTEKKIQLGLFISSGEGLKWLRNEVELPFYIAEKLDSACERYDTALNLFNKKVKAIFDEFSEIDEISGKSEIKGLKITEFNAKMKLLHNEEVVISYFPSIKMSLLKGSKATGINLKFIKQWLLVDDLVHEPEIE